MGKVSDDDTVVVLKKLAICFPAYYLLYYISAAIYCGALGIFSLDTLPGYTVGEYYGKLPFNFKLFEDFDFGNKLAAAAWLSMVTTYVLGVLIIFFIVQSTRKSWDYTVTLTFWHFLISLAVIQGFPVGWVWWVTIVLSTVLMAGAGELLCYFCRDLK